MHNFRHFLKFVTDIYSAFTEYSRIFFPNFSHFMFTQKATLLLIITIYIILTLKCN